MSNMVKVWNDNHLPFKQKFKGTIIEIPAKGFVEMAWDEANSFKSSPYNMRFDGMGNQSPESYKMIRVGERPPDEVNHSTEVKAFKCMRDGSLHASKEALNKYILENFAGDIADGSLDELAPAAKKTKAKKQAEG